MIIATFRACAVVVFWRELLGAKTQRPLIGVQFINSFQSSIVTVPLSLSDVVLPLVSHGFQDVRRKEK